MKKTTIYFEEMSDLYKFIQKVVFNKIAEKDGGYCTSIFSQFNVIPCFYCIDLEYSEHETNEERIKTICNGLKLKIKNIYTLG